jgi:hypothetical protein
MSSIKRKIVLLFVCAGLHSSCDPAALKESLEVTNLRYNTSATPHCAGMVKNISAQAINNLEVQVEFHNADGNRVRTSTEGVSPKTLAPGTSSDFSVPYQKGSNDPPVVSCRVVEFRSSDGGLLLYRDRTAKLSP